MRPARSSSKRRRRRTSWERSRPDPLPTPRSSRLPFNANRIHAGSGFNPSAAKASTGMYFTWHVSLMGRLLMRPGQKQ